MEPSNLFSFSTSELSQDAFLCWMASLSSSDDQKLERAGKSFLAWLWKTAGRGDVVPEQVNLVDRPKRQVERIDVLLHAEVAGSPVTFLIEDKTGTTHHSDQLRRYRQRAESIWPGVVPIYFKTGYHFNEDRAAWDAGYRVVDLEAWVKFLEGVDARNDILQDYRDYMSHLLRVRTTNLENLWAPTGFEHLKTDYVQFEFLKQLQERCPNVDASCISALNRGTNIGGTPWTHLKFCSVDNALPGGIGECLFHRVDKRKEGGAVRFYLSTRQYAIVKGSSDSKNVKLVRLRKYREIFKAAVISAGLPLGFARPASDIQGANESEIGILFFDDSVNTTRAVLEGFPAIHAAFVGEIAHGLEKGASQ